MNIAGQQAGLVGRPGSPAPEFRALLQDALVASIGGALVALKALLHQPSRDA
jgi:hypothetical protein